MRIRHADIDDCARLWGLRVQMLADAPLAYLETLEHALDVGLRGYRDRIETWIGNPERALFVAVDGARLTGQLGAFEVYGYTGLVMVYVAPDHRGRGVLADLVDAAAQYSRGAGRPELLLEVSERNHRAIRAYRRLGFAANGVRRPHPHLPVFTQVEMTRPA